ncbi:hypothetical protein ABZP36_010214 [Zizania latifolia]
MAARRGRGSASGALVAGAVLLWLVLLMEAVPAAEAGTTYFVGDDAGWGKNLDWWLAGKTFYAGDMLVFKYKKEFHDLTVVGGKGFRRCKVPRKLAVVMRTGYDQVTLRRGNNYFICGMPGHCDAGMKLAVKAW